jgi:hypothetical protein
MLFGLVRQGLKCEGEVPLNIVMIFRLNQSRKLQCGGHVLMSRKLEMHAEILWRKFVESDNMDFFFPHYYLLAG